MEPLSTALAEVTAALDRAGVRYAVGGSVAASARGVWRSTMDVDLVAAMRPEQVREFAAGLGPDWYADPEVIAGAIRAGRPFNVIHTQLVFKVDVFPATEEFHLTQLERATVVPLGATGVRCPVTTAEDILLAKLRWYREGGEVSERQWNDVLGLIAAGTALDWEYLGGWAARLGVGDLLERARGEA